MKVAYPVELFEPGNIPQLLSDVAGNIFGMKDVKNLRLEDVEFPKGYLRSFEGPVWGSGGGEGDIAGRRRAGGRTWGPL